MRIRPTTLALVFAAFGGCGDVQRAGEVTLAETLIEMSDALVALREESAMLQAQVDSLREHVARQDTVVRRLASMAGLPLQGP
ncbi:MAG: hypothetical protein M3125_03715 [Gemmatimonadota bacterium]|nr:hypothetical protein [Gemmatimonadota bacterium]